MRIFSVNMLGKSITTAMFLKAWPMNIKSIAGGPMMAAREEVLETSPGKYN